MSITAILDAAQNGGFHDNVAKATGLDAGLTRQAVNRFAPAIAEKLKAKAAADPESFETLLDLLEDGDGTDLNDAAAMTDADAVEDGRAILADVYGSEAAAQAAMARLQPDLDAPSVGTLSAISATAVLSALSLTQAQGAVSSGEDGGGGGLLSVIIAALLKGLMQGAQRQLAPRRRRRRYTGYATRRRSTRRRRKRSPGLDDLFKDILGARR
jgi:hypothetical protein